jgi:hypothetical protein
MCLIKYWDNSENATSTVFPAIGALDAFMFNYVLRITPQVIKSSSHVFKVQSLLHFECCYYTVILFDYIAGYCLAEQVWPDSVACFSDYVEDGSVAKVFVRKKNIVAKSTFSRGQPKLWNWVK